MIMSYIRDFVMKGVLSMIVSVVLVILSIIAALIFIVIRDRLKKIIKFLKNKFK